MDHLSEILHTEAESNTESVPCHRETLDIATSDASCLRASLHLIVATELKADRSPAACPNWDEPPLHCTSHLSSFNQRFPDSPRQLSEHFFLVHSVTSDRLIIRAALTDWIH
jgi:hypothetical protein